MIEKFQNVLWVGLGGFVGAIMRYGLNLLLPAIFSSRYPLATLLSNLIGCFLLGGISELAIRSSVMKPELFIFLTVGLCGGFTTFSTFIFENYNFISQDKHFDMIIYGAISLLVGYIALFLGIWLIRIFFIGQN